MVISKKNHEEKAVHDRCFQALFLDVIYSKTYDVYRIKSKNLFLINMNNNHNLLESVKKLSGNNFETLSFIYSVHLTSGFF